MQIISYFNKQYTVIHFDIDTPNSRDFIAMKIRSSVNSSIVGNRSMSCWPVNRTVMQRIEIFWVNNQSFVYLLYWFYIGEKKTMYYNVF